MDSHHTCNDLQLEADSNIIITDPESDRYHTFGFISWWRQEIVRNAKVMVIGAGALGNEVLKNLALMGVGYIFIVDFDTIEDANLSRSVLFRSEDQGRKKAEVAAERVKSLNPDVKVKWFHGDVNFDLGLGIFRRMDAIIGCLDNRAARLSINRYCWHMNKTWIDGAIQELLGEARVFRPNDGACYECTLNKVDYDIINMRYSCPLLARQNILQGKVPTTPTIASIIAGVQTQDALKIMHGMSVQAGKALVFNGLTNDVYLTEYPVKDDCMSHWMWDDIVELPDDSAATMTVDELLALAKSDLGEDAILEFVDGQGRDIVITFHCANCKTTVDVLQPRQLVSDVDSICPDCGRIRQPLLSHTINGSETFLDKTLLDIGIPLLHVVAARSGTRYRYYELSGDAPAVLAFK